VRMPRYEQRVEDAWVAPSDAQVLAAAGATTAGGETGYSAYERLTMRPALTVNGIMGGYQGPGRMAVLPARARAKLSFRLVPDQDPMEVDRLLRRHLPSIAPHAVQVVLTTGPAARPVVLERRLPVLEIAARSYQHGFGARPAFVRSGGTIPVVAAFREVLKIPTVLMGFALPDDRMHAPNERFRIGNLFRGAATSIRFLELASTQRTGSCDCPTDAANCPDPQLAG
jgi:acetylornithine deacetylase/succinyl-diaminopimelate desuccinylase-like protein